MVVVVVKEVVLDEGVLVVIKVVVVVVVLKVVFEGRSMSRGHLIFQDVAATVSHTHTRSGIFLKAGE